MLWLYDLPRPVMGLLIVTFTTFACFATYWAARRIAGVLGDEHHDLAFSVLQVVATVQSLLLAFSAVSVWESYTGAGEAVLEEANTIGQLARDLAIFDSAESRQARVQLRAYGQMVVDQEWADLKHGQTNEVAWAAFDDLFRAIGTIQPDTPKRVALMPEIWMQINELVKVRRERLDAGESAIPATLWSVVLIGTILTMMTTVVLTPSRFNLTMIGVLGGSFGLVLFFLVAMDHPFAGGESIDPGPIVAVIANIDRWDRTSHQP